MTVSHHRPYLPWHLANILSISSHSTAVVSSKATLLWPPYTSTLKPLFSFFSFFLLLIKYIPTLIYLPGVLKTGLPEILSQVQHIAGNLLKLNLLKALILLV